MFTDKIEAKDFDKMDPEYKELLGHVLAIQADCEIGGPHLYVETMLPAAPTKLDQLIIARTAAEEIDVAHAVGEQATGDNPLARLVHRGHPVLCGPQHDARARGHGGGVVEDDQRVDRFALHAREGGL